MKIDLIQGLEVKPEHLAVARDAISSLGSLPDGFQAADIVKKVKDALATQPVYAGTTYPMRLVDRLLQRDRAAGRIRYANRRWYAV